MHPDFAKILVEPKTHAPLTLVVAKEEDGQIIEGTLTSTVSGKRYNIVRGIPRFVPDEAYVTNFGKQWNMFREVQLDSSSNIPESKKRFDEETGWTRDLIGGQLVLDAGCGAGRFAEVAAGYGAHVVAMDLSSAVEAVQETLRQYPNTHVVQADIFAPPFRPGTFPFAYSIGVLQHTPDPDRAVTSVVSTVKPGGKFALTIYGRKPWTKLNGKYWLRHITKRMPQELLLGAIKGGMPVLFPITDTLFRLPHPLGHIAKFVIPVANYVDRKDRTREQRYAEAVLDTFDALAPTYDLPMTAKEVERAVREVGPADMHFRSRVPVVVCGERR
jgi:SAM-dependent methyltransferase